MDAPLRASDADRDAVAERLRWGTGEGRLTVEELEERLERAYRAQTREELDALVADLPSGAGAGAGALETTVAGRVAVRPGEGGAGWVVSVMGGVERRGRWRLASRCRVINLMGSSDLDLVDVELAAERVQLTVFSLMGGSRIRVPESLRVEVSKFALMGGHDVDLGSGPVDRDGPLLRVRLISIMGGGELRRARTPVGRRRRPRRLDGGSTPRGGAIDR